MSELNASFAELVELLVQGRTVEVIERFYDDEVVVFENRTLARAGRAACLAFEQQQRRSLTHAVDFRLCACACNERTGKTFLEYVLRFTGSDGRPLRIEEVAVQTWNRGKIVQERFYYEGVVDEGSDDDEGSADDDAADTADSDTADADTADADSHPGTACLKLESL